MSCSAQIRNSTVLPRPTPGLRGSGAAEQEGPQAVIAQVRLRRLVHEIADLTDQGRARERQALGDVGVVVSGGICGDGRR
ncbi:hypothetical protein [Streptomyces lydicus]|uniref:hypothetical protein n=1 Tax=Streptomyces lydicus TaxID=47763 RepID=UPI0019D6F2DB|nr:hypothetical protein [Streptomyces lydicus]